MTSYTVAFLSPDPVTMYLSSTDISQLSTEDDSLDWRQKKKKKILTTNTLLYFLNPYRAGGITVWSDKTENSSNFMIISR